MAEDVTTRKWRRSSYSGDPQKECVEVAPGRAWLVRDTKRRGGGYIEVSQTAWRAFLDHVR